MNQGTKLPWRRLLRRWLFSPNFDDAKYRAANPDVDEAIKAGLLSSGAVHWRLHGRFENRPLNSDEAVLLPSDFEERSYLLANPDVAAAVADGRAESGAAHWLAHGRLEGRRLFIVPTDFDEELYLAANPDVAAAVKAGGFESGLAHWMACGRLERRQLFTVPPDFDEELYLAANPDVAAAVEAGGFASGLAHWLAHGRLENRVLRHGPRGAEKVPEDFEESAYFEANPDVRPIVAMGGFESGQAHWLALGQFENRRLALSPRLHLKEEFDAFGYARLNPDLQRTFGRNADRLFTHWDTAGFYENRRVPNFRPYVSRSTDVVAFAEKANEVAMYGYFDAPTGMGSAARGYRAAIESLGYPVRSRNASFSRADIVKEMAEIRNGPGSKVNFFHLNADMIDRFLLDGRHPILNDRFNIALWAWELAAFRPDWASAFGAVDEIWVPSEFCRRAVASISPVRVEVVPHVVDVALPRAPLGRAHFAIPDNCYVFLCVFDAGSLVDRKNPQAAIRAFRKVFGARRDVLLLLKYHGAQHYPGSILPLHQLAGDQENIRFIGHSYGDDELVSLKMAADCLISPHRSEGFGLNIAEAMWLGKPVIATMYSGNMDFMTAENSFPIGYRLVEVVRQTGPYPAGYLWAQPDEDALGEAMQQVVRDPDKAKSRAALGTADIRSKYSLAAVARRIGDRFDELEVFSDGKKFVEQWRRGTHFVWQAQAALPEMKAELTGGPLISVIVPVFNVSAHILTKCIESVRNQVYENWQLVLHDDCSTSEETRAALREYEGVDPRICISWGRANVGISTASNAALELTIGDFVAMLDNDDELSHDALLEVSRAIQGNPNADLLYSDEDKIDEDGRYCDTYFKPDWSPEHLESVMYLLHLLVVRRSVMVKLGGFRKEVSGAQDFDLALRVSRSARSVVHIPKILYHWRKVAGSSAARVEAKPWGHDAAARALADHVAAGGRGAKVEPGLIRGFYRVRDPIPPKTGVTLIILTNNQRADVVTRGNINLFDNFTRSIFEKSTSVCDWHVLAVDNHNLEPRQRVAIEGHGGRVVSYSGTGPFNFCRKVNFALSLVNTEFVILLNDDMEVISADWIDALIEKAIRPGVGVVGARLLFADGRIQHVGGVMGIADTYAHVYHQWPGDFIGYNGYTHCTRNYLAVTGACMATRTRLLREIGGFDESMPGAYNDIDACLKIYSMGYRNVYTPHAALFHFERATQQRWEEDKTEYSIFAQRWHHYLNNDPYYNPNLSRTKLDFSPR
jgi:GT2 family glycosyltransferase/glycosyltransferase involved in cell wall biosynthesis